METINKQYIVNEQNKKIAVQIPIKTFERLEEILENYALDKFVMMLNHIHGIINIRNDTHGRGVLQYAPTETVKFKSPSQTIGAIIRGYKSSVTKSICYVKCPVFLILKWKNHIDRVGAPFYEKMADKGQTI